MSPCKLIITEYKESLPDSNPEWPPKIQRATRFIHANMFKRRLTVKWMKEECRLNGNGFSGKFKYYIGDSPKRYWLGHRVEAGKKLLTDKRLMDESIIHLALELGFRSHAAFTMIFKEYECCTPSEYRNE